MTKIEVTLISGRTAKQGIGLEEGKPSEAYINSVCMVQLCPGDVEKLGVNEGDPVTVATDHGSVTVHWEGDEGLDSGIIFFPYGPWANQVYASGTGSTGMPLMKGIPAMVEPGGKVLLLEEIVESLREEG